MKKKTLIDEVLTVLYNRLDDIEEKMNANFHDEIYIVYEAKHEAYEEIIQLLVKGK